jgi:GDPmannose 4,6-dehydratase
MKKTAVITGIAGQDGAFLAKLLIDKGYHVIGADRRRVDTYYWRLSDLKIINKIEFIYFDLLEESNITLLIKKRKPNEFYNLAAQSFVKASFDLPLLTSNVNAMGVLRILDAIKNYSPSTRFYQASTSEMYGMVQEVPQNENTPFYPRSPYGVSKLFGHWMVVNYRESYNLFACSGILFNHESEYRGSEFVTQKIVENAVKIIRGRKTPITLGNLEAKRDWGYAKDYVYGMYLMLQVESPSDYVLATNQTHTVREFIELVFDYYNIKIIWEGLGENEKGYNTVSGDEIINISKDYYRPAEVEILKGDYSKAKNILGWNPKTNLKEIVEIMIKHAEKRQPLSK